MSASRVKKRILIVDDDQNQALLLRSLMQANGFEVIDMGRDVANDKIIVKAVAVEADPGGEDRTALR